jgi:hypothetical protein
MNNERNLLRMMRRSEIEIEIEIEKRVIVEGAVMTVTAEGAVWTVMVMTVIVEKTASMGRRRSHSIQDRRNCTFSNSSISNSDIDTGTVLKVFRFVCT